MARGRSISGLFRLLLLSHKLKKLITIIRYYYFRFSCKEIKVYELDETYYLKKYSLDWIKKIQVSERPIRLISLLSTLCPSSSQTIDFSENCLSIGPRYEYELLSLYAAGFKWKNIYGVDIYSYSPKIIVGSSSDIPFPDNFFELVVAGWVTVYSSDKDSFINELNRITKDGAYFLIGNTKVTRDFQRDFSVLKENDRDSYTDPPEKGDPTRSPSGTLDLLNKTFNVDVIAVKYPIPTDTNEDEFLGLYRLWKK